MGTHASHAGPLWGMHRVPAVPQGQSNLPFSTAQSCACPARQPRAHQVWPCMCPECARLRAVWPDARPSISQLTVKPVQHAGRSREVSCFECRPTKHRTPSRPVANQSIYLHMGQVPLHAQTHAQASGISDEVVGMAGNIQMLSLHGEG